LRSKQQAEISMNRQLIVWRVHTVDLETDEASEGAIQSVRDNWDLRFMTCNGTARRPDAITGARGKQLRASSAVRTDERTLDICSDDAKNEDRGQIF
jgi:hypothetical protein